MATTLISQAEVKTAELALEMAKDTPFAFELSAENNVFDTLDEATAELEGMLYAWAKADCEGYHNCGGEHYYQEFIVDGLHYLATMTFEYDRHDKTFYIDHSEFTYRPAE